MLLCFMLSYNFDLGDSFVFYVVLLCRLYVYFVVAYMSVLNMLFMLLLLLQPNLFRTKHLSSFLVIRTMRWSYPLHKNRLIVAVKEQFLDSGTCQDLKLVTQVQIFSDCCSVIRIYWFSGTFYIFRM